MSFFSKPKFKLNSPLGQRGERAALVYLANSGYKIIETNYCNVSGRRKGEIDIIAKDNEEFVFIEVKTRKSSDYINNPLPQESITRAKLYKLNKVASYYLSANKLLDVNHRFDAIILIADSEKNTAKLQHLKNIFI